MENSTLNKCLALGEIDHPGMFPHLEELKQAPFVFKTDFGLKELPMEPGILSIRGARQYGKSTWLEQMLCQTIVDFGAGTAFYLNGDFILSLDKLEHVIAELLPAFAKKASVRRLFIDEITAIPNWEIALKRLADQGQLKDVLVITTGSNAIDLHRGTEKLPGRKGRLTRTEYLFTPVSYKEFYRLCHDHLRDNTLVAYLLSGGSPIACTALASSDCLPEYVIALTRDWIEGEIARSGRSRHSLYSVLNVLFKWGGTPVGQAKLARESALANNTVAAGYVTILHDLGVVIPVYPWDSSKNTLILRKECKYHLTNLLAAVAYYPDQIRRVEDFYSLPEKAQGMWIEWLVSQELLRRSSIAGNNMLGYQVFWKSKEHEIDFVVSPDNYIEVKRGASSALEYSWFSRQFPEKQLLVINKKRFLTDQVKGVTLEEFLLDEVKTSESIKFLT